MTRKKQPEKQPKQPEKKHRKKVELKTNRCAKCGRSIKGPSYFVHVRKCQGTRREFVDNVYRRRKPKAVEVTPGALVETPRTPRPAKLYLSSLIVDLDRARELATKTLRSRLPKTAKAYLQRLLLDYDGAIRWARSMLDLVDLVDVAEFVQTLGRHGVRLKIRDEPVRGDDD